MGKFEIYSDTKGEYRFRLLASNGKNILASEGYKAKTGCMFGIDSVRRNSKLDERYERLIAKSGEPYFTLKASNGQIIGLSELYSSTAAMESGIASVKQNAPYAFVDDLS